MQAITGVAYPFLSHPMHTPLKHSEVGLQPCGFQGILLNGVNTLNEWEGGHYQAFKSKI